jgi:thiosulfate/3-mercaptopyruvate sulfurtransferase
MEKGNTMIDASALVETEWLAARLNHASVKILDASYFVPGGIEAARRQYDEGHIPGAAFFDINDVADPTGAKEHAFPTADIFAQKVGALGIANTDHVVAYDHVGGACAAARVWFMFRAYGHHNVSVLNGGRTKWLAEGRPMSTDTPRIPPAHFTARGDAPVRSKAEMRTNIASGQFQVLDARAKGRFEATEPEPRAGLRGGHIPGSLNLPFLELIDPVTKVWKDAPAIADAMKQAGVAPDQPLTTTCGSGVSACALALGAHLTGKTDVAIYDGSWVEWGSDPSVPIATGPARKPI